MVKIKIFSSLSVLFLWFLLGTGLASAADCSLSFSPDKVNLGEKSAFSWSVNVDFDYAHITCALAGDADVTDALKSQPVGSIDWVSAKAGTERCILILEGPDVTCGSNSLTVATPASSVEPSIDCSFASPEIKLGETVNLSWCAKNIGALTIESYGFGLDGVAGSTSLCVPTHSVTPTTIGAKSYVFKGYAGNHELVKSCTAKLNVINGGPPDPKISCSFKENKITAGGTTTLSWDATGSYVVGVSCSGLYSLGTTGVDLKGSGELTMPDAGSESCIFTAYNSEGKSATCKADLEISKSPTPTQPTGTCECSANSPFSGGSSCASGTTCDGCHCIASSTAVNGVCDNSTNGQALSSAPTTNLCTKGSASAVSGTGPWNWTCVGSNNGTTAYCSATKSGATPSGSNCGSAANSNYTCSATQTSGTLCSSGNTCYPNNGYPPSPCPTNIALSGNSAHWYCGNSNCYANKSSNCSPNNGGNVVPLLETSYKSLWQFQYTYDSDGKKNTLGYKNINNPANRNSSEDMQLSALYNFNCGDADYARSNNIRSCDYSSEEILATKIYLAPGTRNTVTFSKTQGSGSNAIVMMRFGEPPQGTYSMDSLNKDYPYKDAVSMDDVTGKDFIARRTSSGLEHIFDGNLPDDSPGGWLYLRIIPVSSTVHYISYQGHRDFAKYKTWYDNMTASNSWLPDGDPGKAKNVSSGDSSAYKSVTQIEQIYCSEYDANGYCTKTTPRILGFKNMFPPEKVAVQNGYDESYIREDFSACDFNGGNYCSYNHHELSTFKLYIVPGTKLADVTIYNSQGNTPGTIKFVAIARFGEPPTGDYNRIDPTDFTLGAGTSNGCTIKDATGKDCVTRNKDGITDVFSDSNIAEGGWLYIKFVELENIFYNMHSIIIVNSPSYTTWYNTMTTSNSWLPDGDPGEQAPAPVCSETCTGGNFTCQATAPTNSTISSNTCCGGKTCYQCSSGYYWNTETCSPLSSSCSLSVKLTASKENDPFVTKLKTELTASSGTVKCDSQDCDGGIISNTENNGCNFTCTYNNSGEYNPSLHVADSACAKNPTTKITIASAPDPATGSDCAKETCKDVSCNSKNGSTNPWIKGTKTEGCATVTAKASPASLTVPDKTYLTWTSSGASRMEAECVTGPVTINRGVSFLSDADCAKSELIDKCTDKGYELSFASNQTGTEICTFYPTNSSNGLPGTPSSVTILAKEKVTSSPSCTGTTPTNAITCPDDKLNLITDLSWISVGHSVADCSNERKCEYYTLANSNNITGYVCKPNNANCAANTCHDVYCDDGCNRIKGTKDCLMFP